MQFHEQFTTGQNHSLLPQPQTDILAGRGTDAIEVTSKNITRESTLGSYDGDSPAKGEVIKGKFIEIMSTKGQAIDILESTSNG